MFQVGNTEVRHSNGLDLATSVYLFHLFPGVPLVPRMIHRASAVRIGREKLRSLVGNETTAKPSSEKFLGDHGKDEDKHWPVDQIEVQVVCLEIFQRLGKTLGDIGLMGIPPAKTFD